MSITPQMLLMILDNPIAYHRIYATITGSVTSAVMLSQSMYWTPRTTDPHGWFYKTADEWQEETGLSRREQETARRILKDLQILEEKKQGLPCKLFFRLNLEVLYRLIVDGANQDLTKGKSKNGGKRQTAMYSSAIQDDTKAPNNLYTEITSEITSQINAPEKKIEISALESNSEDRIESPPIAPPPPFKFIDPYQRAMEVRQREPEVKKMMDDREFLKFLIPLMKRWDAYKTSCDSSDARKWVRVAIEPKNDKCDSRWDESRDRYQDFLDVQQQRSQQPAPQVAPLGLIVTAPPAHIRDRFKAS